MMLDLLKWFKPCQPNLSENHFHLRVLVEKSETGDYRAVCLDWDLVAEDPSLEGAMNQMKALIDSHWQFAVDKGWEDSVWRPAPEEFWDRFYKAQSKGRHPNREPEFVYA